jgi:hypothetical protein
MQALQAEQVVQMRNLSPTIHVKYRVAVEELKIGKDALKERILAAVQASFMNPADKKKVFDSIQKELAKK